MKVVKSTSVASFIQEALEDKKWGKIKGSARYNRIKEYNMTQHEYQLFRGEQPFGKPKMMTGWDAGQENKRYEDKFYQESGVEGARLWRWKLANGRQEFVARHR